MLIQHLPLLSTQRLILASASPRRNELLQNLGLKVEVIPSFFDETLEKSAFSCAGEYAAATAQHKAIEVLHRALRAADGRKPNLVIGADTVVEFNGMILEKPKDFSDAVWMLSNLSGQQHHVFTGVALVLPLNEDPVLHEKPQVCSFWEDTKVEFANLEKEAINAYVSTGEPLDKAGAYGIQGIGGSFVKSITGCFFNVVGFPVHRFSVEVDRLIKSGAFHQL